jgi:catechol 2,3-dioxygenase-like lactoylglutathione lyase family enzyme
MQLSAADYVVVIVDDLDRSVRFYADVLGLPLGHRSGPYAQFSTGATRISLYERDAMSGTLGVDGLRPPPRDAPGFELGFKVDNVDAAYAELIEAGADGVTPPRNRPWGQRTAYVRDPDGHLIELVHAPQR